MDRSQPSFYRLFRRGRYWSSALLTGAEDDEEAGARKQRERFVVAALAFCLRHDEDFRRHFWQTICRVPEDPKEMPPIEPDGILLEPPPWADLRLISRQSGIRYVWVVEAKTGAALEPKQDPSSAVEFEQEGSGYGALFEAEEGPRKARMRYIVLGANPQPIIPVGLHRLGISVQGRDWTDLMKGLKPSTLVKDLIQTLGELQIYPFFMEKLKGVQVQSGIESVGKAYAVLIGVCERFGIKDGANKIEAHANDDGTGNIGIYLNPPKERPRPSEFQQKLPGITNDTLCGWFGYTYDSEGKVTKEVWFYFIGASSQKSQSLLAKLRTKFPTTQESGIDEEGYFGLIVSSPPELSSEDFAWFESVFLHAVPLKSGLSATG